MTLHLSPNFDWDDEQLAANLSKGYHLLRAKRRRQVIWCMNQLAEDESVTVREIAKEIAAQEQGVSVPAVANSDYRSVYTNLVQHHLPRLDEAGVVEFDDSRKEIAPGSNTQVLALMSAITVPALRLYIAEDMT